MIAAQGAMRIPERLRSFASISPVPNTSAFGGVATGMINAQLAPIPMMITRVSFGIPREPAIAAKTGTKSAAEAVLLVNSVVPMINSATKNTTKIFGNIIMAIIS